ncbi:MAG: hypothetical protein JSW66_05480 [Phycisphaerales bacterium]|nr:MAG: hypothetical protein JSW66_05480 [Phycisphaerales bacterium]
MTERILRHLFVPWAALAALFVAGRVQAEYPFQFPGPAPGSAQAVIEPAEIVLENEVLSCAWSIVGGRLKPQRLTDRLASATLELHETECFQLILDDGRIVKASDLQMAGKPRLRRLEPSRTSCRLAERFAGRQIAVILTCSDENLSVKWSAVLRDGSSYVRQEITFEAKNEPIAVKEIVLWELPAAGARVMGTVDGSPVAAGNVFFALENPLSKSRLLQENPNAFRCSLARNVPLMPSQPLRQSSAAGVVPEGQLRRGFLYYLERERAHPYRPFLHYNSWYDIGYRAEKIQPKQFLQVVELFGRELISRRGVTMDSFVLDDGWDNPASLWRFHEGFPDGFAPLKRAVETYDSVLGAWLSPFGGYGEAKQARLKYGREQGFETNKSGFSLAGPKYYSRFREVCVGMIHEYGLNYFKFDGIGTTGRPTGPAPEFVNDMEALMQLIGDLRQAKPDVFINITSGMWTSPFWLWYGDSVWRSGRDWGTHGAGSQRQQQVTYRDKETYHNVVKRSPLHPLNSLMTQGVMFANHGLPDEADYLAEDIRDFFASGTNCQELYITPSLMTPEHWDALAEAARWSGGNTDVLMDTHWVGGDPAQGQIYGWAAWSKRKGILSLRNPSDKPGVITIDIGKTFELPRGAAQKYSLKSPWKEDLGNEAIVLSAGKEHTFELKPFDVLVFDAKGL